MKNRISNEILSKIYKDCKFLDNVSIYMHKNLIARDIFWQRLDYSFKYIKENFNKDIKVLDFGGGGEFL